MDHEAQVAGPRAAQDVRRPSAAGWPRAVSIVRMAATRFRLSVLRQSPEHPAHGIDLARLEAGEHLPPLRAELQDRLPAVGRERTLRMSFRARKPWSSRLR